MRRVRFAEPERTNAGGLARLALLALCCGPWGCDDGGAGGASGSGGAGPGGSGAAGGPGGSGAAGGPGGSGAAGGSGGSGAAGGPGGAGAAGGAPSPGDAADAESPRDATPDSAPTDAGVADLGPDDDAATPPDPDAGPPEPGLVLNEVDCHGRDWVEIYNRGPDPARLDGWTISDDPADPERGHGLDGVVAPGEWVDFRQQNDEEDGFEFGIACGDDVVALVAPDGAIVDTASPPAAPSRYAWGRLPDGAGDFVRTDPTRGEPNRPARAPGAAWLDDPWVDPAGPWRGQVEVRIAEAGLASLAQDPYLYVPAVVRVTTPAGVATEWLEVGVHVKGRAGSFRDLSRKSALRIDLNRYVPDQKLDGMESLTLNNMVQDPSFVHEWATYSLFREMNLPAPRVGYAWVTLNEENMGLYAMIEPYDDPFLAEWFPSTAHLYEGLYGQDLHVEYVRDLDVEEGADGDRRDLQVVIAALDAAPEGEAMRATAERVDWAQVVRVMAAEIYLGHWDGYTATRNNWYMHFDADGRLRLLPWGADQTWGADLDLHEGQGRLMQHCMADLACRAAYDRALASVVEAYDRLDLPAAITALHARLRPSIEADPRRETSVEGSDGALQGTLDFMARRRQHVGEQLQCLLDARDEDGDGFTCDRDCDPDDERVHPGAPEVCGDDIDQDCSGRADDAPECPDCEPVFLGPHRYLTCPNPKGFDDAAAHCAAYGSAPARIDGGAENTWLWQQAMARLGQWWWIGADDRAEEGRWTWADGTPAEFLAWEHGQPDNAGEAEHCAHYFDWGPTWNDIPCDAGLGVLCEDVCLPGEDADGDGALRCGDDCDDGDPDRAPGRDDVCGDGIDQDCDGFADEGGTCDCVARADDAGRAYRFCPRGRTWEQARDTCRALGMDLTEIDDEDENGWLARAGAEQGGGGWWIGLSDRLREGRFVQLDGREPRFTAWNAGEPNDAGGEDCVELISGPGVWNDLPCDHRHPAICEAVDP